MSDARTIYRNGGVVTLDPALPEPEAVGTIGDRIVAVGDESDVRRILGGIDVDHDLEGGTLVPGFVDGHTHLEMTCVAAHVHVPLHAPPFARIADMLEEVARVRRQRPQGWIVFRSSFTLQDKVEEGRLPHRDELDRVSPGQPVVILAGLHVACLNSPALAELGISGPAAAPAWMAVHVDATGAPDGVVTEVWDRLPSVDVDTVIASLRAHARDITSANGVTSVSTVSSYANDIPALQQLSAAGELPVRVRYYVHVPALGSIDDVIGLGLASGSGSPMLRFGGVKIFVDGEGGDGLGHGDDDMKWSRDELLDLVRRAELAGIQLMMHAVTPAAIRLAADAVLAARADGSRSILRHRIEHAGDYLDPRDLSHLARAGVGIVASPHFTVSDGAADDDFQPLAAVLGAGLPIIGATDTTGTVPESASPLFNIAAAGLRRRRDGRVSPHRIDVRSALRMFTDWSAFGAGEEHEKGRIATGLLADFAVLSADPLRIPLEELPDVAVLQTIVGGQSVFHRPRGPISASI